MTLGQLAKERHLEVEEIWKLLCSQDIYLSLDRKTEISSYHITAIKEGLERLSNEKYGNHNAKISDQQAKNLGFKNWGNFNSKHEMYLEKNVFCGEFIKFEISGFKAFKEPVEFQLNELNIFVGKNNSGKSAAIDAINFVLNFINIISKRTSSTINLPFNTKKLLEKIYEPENLFNYESDSISIKLFKKTHKRLNEEIVILFSLELIENNIFLRSIRLQENKQEGPLTEDSYYPNFLLSQLNSTTELSLLSMYSEKNKKDELDNEMIEWLKEAISSLNQNDETDIIFSLRTFEFLDPNNWSNFVSSFYNYLQECIDIDGEENYPNIKNIKDANSLRHELNCIELDNGNFQDQPDSNSHFFGNLFEAPKGAVIRFYDIIDRIFFYIINLIENHVETEVDFFYGKQYEELSSKLPKNVYKRLERMKNLEISRFDTPNKHDGLSHLTEAQLNEAHRNFSQARAMLGILHSAYVQLNNLDYSTETMYKKNERFAFYNEKFSSNQEAIETYNILNESYQEAATWTDVYNEFYISLLTRSKEEILLGLGGAKLSSFGNEYDIELTSEIIEALVCYIYSELFVKNMKGADYNIKGNRTDIKAFKRMYSEFKDNGTLRDVFGLKEYKTDVTLLERYNEYFRINVADFFPGKTETINASNRFDRQRTIEANGVYLISNYIRRYKERISLLKKIGYKEKSLETRLQNLLYDLNIAKQIEIMEIEDLYIIKLTNPHTGKTENIRDLGFGYSQVLPLLFEKILSDTESTLKYSDEHKLLIIEEPETNLHPNLQAELADIIASINQPFKVVETHSEYLIRRLQRRVAEYHQDNKAPKGIDCNKINIYYFYPPGEVPKDKEQVEQIKILEDGTLSQPFGGGFMDQADKDYNILFQMQQEKTQNN